MEIKKSEKADLQGKKFIFAQIGFVTSLLLIFAVLNVSQGTIVIQELAPSEEEVTSELPPIVRPEEPRPQEKVVKVVAPTLSEVIEVVDNTMELEDVDIFDPEADEDLKVWDNLPTGEPNDGELIQEDVPVIRAEISPSFGGKTKIEESNLAFHKWVNKNVKYPALAMDNNIAGKVVCRFVISQDGSIRDITVLSSPDRILTEEVSRVLKSAPRWIPGKQRGKPVSVYATITVVFQNN